MYLSVRHFTQKLILLFAVIFIANAFIITSFGQETSASNSNSNQSTGTPTPTPTPVPTPIPVAEVVTQTESTIKKLDKIKEGLDKSPNVSVITTELPKLKVELDSRVSETTKLLKARPSLETLRTVEQDWNSLAKNIPAWKDDLTSQLTVLDNYSKELQYLKDQWEMTLNSLSAGNKPDNSTNTNANISITEVPNEIITKIRQTIDSITKTEKLVEDKSGQLLSIQSRLSKEESRIEDTLNSIKEVREEALSHLFIQDSPAIWNSRKQTDTTTGMINEIRNTVTEQVKALKDYASRKFDNFILHGVILLLLVGLFYWLRKRMRPWIEKEPDLERAFTVFEFPIISALILSIIFSGQFYPQAPRILTSLLGAAALIPGIIFLRQILERPLFPILNALMIFYFVDRLREITATLPLISRILFLLEIIGVVIFLVWFLRSKRLSAKIQVKHQRIFTTIRKVIPFVLGFFGIAMVANIFGFVSLSTVIGNGVLGSAYVALILYTAVQIVESLLIFAFRVPPISSLNMIKTHPQVIQHKIFRILQWLAIIGWVLLTLNLFSIRDTVYTYAKDILTAELVIGSIAISLGDVIIFAFTVWLAFALSRLIRFILTEDVYTRVNLAGGVPYAISTVLHYAILVVGFIFAIAALGIDLTKFTILAGAFGVGLGFGLQNIVNNFVSGLILLFERPVKVNDVVQIGTHQGDLKRIGLRASVLRTLDGAEVIVPNGQLISEEVTNWTFSDQQRRLEINVGVAYGSNPREIMELLTKVAEDNKSVLQDPGPRTIFVGFGDNSLDFQLRAWTDSEQWVVLKSDLTLAVHDALEEANIEIPFPQRDLHLRGIDQEIIKQIQKKYE